MGNETKLKKFSPPGELQELSPDNQTKWSEQYVSRWMEDEIKGNASGRIPLPQFFNGTKTAYDRSQEGIAITWAAFPKRVSNALHSLYYNGRN
jgi:hypothetical protein